MLYGLEDPRLPAVIAGTQRQEEVIQGYETMLISLNQDEGRLIIAHHCTVFFYSIFCCNFAMHDYVVNKCYIASVCLFASARGYHFKISL